MFSMRAQRVHQLPRAALHRDGAGRTSLQTGLAMMPYNYLPQLLWL